MSASSQSTARREAMTSRPRYRQQPIDQNVPPIPASRLLSIPSTRSGRSFRQQPIDPHPMRFYGDTVIQKSPGTTRVFFQNVKGLTHTPSQEDYRYYMSCLQGLNIDIAGLAETMHVGPTLTSAPTSNHPFADTTHKAKTSTALHQQPPTLPNI
jgi:hypothetical protein